MKIAIGSDHAGFDYKQRLKAYLTGLGHDVHDFGTDAAEPSVDYPLFIRPTAEAVAKGECRAASCSAAPAMAKRSPTGSGCHCACCWSLETAASADSTTTPT